MENNWIVSLEVQTVDPLFTSLSVGERGSVEQLSVATNTKLCVAIFWCVAIGTLTQIRCCHVHCEEDKGQTWPCLSCPELQWSCHRDFERLL